MAHPLETLAREIMEEMGTKFHYTKPAWEYLPSERPEREGAETGAVFILSQKDIDEYRIGSSWMEGRLREGDVCMCIAHGGDCFNDYILLELTDSDIRGIPEAEFGAYVLVTKPLAWKPTKKEFDVLRDGKWIVHRSDNHMRTKHPLVAEVEKQQLNVESNQRNCQMKTDNEKLKEIHKKVERLHKGVIDEIRTCQDKEDSAEKDNETSDDMKEIMAEKIAAENKEFQKQIEIAREPKSRQKVDDLHKGFIKAMEEAQLETGDLEITYVSDTVADDEPQDDDLLPVDTALMEKCVEAARLMVVERPVVRMVTDPEGKLIYQIGQSLFIGALLDSLVNAVGDLRETIEEGMTEVREVLVPIEEI